jgi:hypothetical protein
MAQVAKLIARADVLTVTNDVLKAKYEKLNPNIVVVPNCFNDRMMNARPEIDPIPKKLINWRGSPTHQKDIAVHMQAILQLCKEFPDWTWNFIGETFWMFSESMPAKNFVQCPAVDQATYWHLIAQLQPAIQIVPLEDNEFNRSKSNIAWIEGAYAGAACLAPDWEHWRQPGVINYTNPVSFYRKLKSLMEGKWDLAQLGKNGWEGVQQKFLLSKVNELRAQLVLSLTNKRKPFVSAPLVGISPKQPDSSSENSQSNAS